ncbi:preprotein translocase subunit SecA [Bernardetia sp. OM2101]|uniref:preprotein translocase subunit SecA n=1 Tax=Bernardetia sp. OM2101 TaxID=3344876 RepID=UPI0035CF4443
MFNSITSVVAKVFGTKSERDRKKLIPYVEQVNLEYKQLHGLTDDQLREKTRDVRDEINQHVAQIDTNIADFKKQIAEDPEMDINAKEKIFVQIDKLEKDRNVKLDEVLDKVLPVVFAIVKDTARRLTENKKLTVKATDHDRRIIQKRQQEGRYHNEIEIVGEGDNATVTWHNKWTAMGQEIEWNMIHYDVQIMGGVVLYEGKISEMATGEGKTLVATLPAFLRALSGKGVHVITVNDYLAKRDSEWVAPIFEFHEMMVDCIDKHQPNTEARRKAYAADITYGTNNEFGFDYLRDNMARETEELVQRGHYFAMIDEVDSVLIDDARTPLIISGPVQDAGAQEYDIFKPRIEKLVALQRKLSQDFLQEAKQKIKAGNEKEAGLPLFRAFRGLPEYKPLIKFLSEPGMKALLQKTENEYLADNARRMPEADEPLYFFIEKKQNKVQLTEKGTAAITKDGEDPRFFILPDVATQIARIDNDKDLEDKQKLETKEKLLTDYSIKTSRIHTVTQLLKAYTLFEKDTDYVVMEDKVKIVDEKTGRIMDGRRYSDGLHQALEAKESVEIEDATQTYATVTLQNYFRMYYRLSGMTGTAETEATEFWEIYKLDVVIVPTNRPIQRDDRQDKIFRSVREKYNAVADEIQHSVQEGRPVLVGTTTVENSEILSRMLQMRKIPHEVLNAKQHQKESEIVAKAGVSGSVTIATNMAGRGTDIKLSPESKKAGGLAIIGTERHDSRRVDRQLRGRAGRQGDVGISQFFVSLEDPLMRMFGSDRIAKIMDRLGLEEGEVIQHSMITKSIENAQRKVEENHFGSRKNLLEYDDVMNQQREVIYKRRRNALFGERLELDIMLIFAKVSDQLVQIYKGDFESFHLEVFSLLGIQTEITKSEFQSLGDQTISQRLYEEAYNAYRQKNKDIAAKVVPTLENIHAERGGSAREIIIPITDQRRMVQMPVNIEETIEKRGANLVATLEQTMVLSIIDNLWKEHLRNMDDLRQQVQMARFEQKDPLVIYKMEAFQLFRSLLDEINQEITSFLSRARLHEPDPEELQALQNAQRRQLEQRMRREQEAKQQMEVNRAEEVDTTSDNQRAHGTQQNIAPTAPRTVSQEPGRNDVVTVRYKNGQVKQAKYKSVMSDVRNGECVVI